MRTLRIAGLVSVACAIAAFVACAPSSFDGLVGGTRLVSDAGDAGPVVLLRDDLLAPPRPLAPLSASWILGSRPRLAWELAESTIGARVEMCRDRGCTGERKTYDVIGVEQRIAEDLAPGIWFWRLYSRTAGTFGTKPSATWEVLVRGGKGEGAVGGAVVDLDGDGRPDLVSTIDLPPSADGGGPLTSVVELAGTSDDATSFAETGERSFYLFTGDARMAVADVDGDGYVDVTVAEGNASIGYDLATMYGGGAHGIDFARVDVVQLPVVDGPIDVREGGDNDGDGRGDVIVGGPKDSFGVFGSPRGLGGLQYYAQAPVYDAGAFDAGIRLPPGAFAVHGGFDRSGEGLAEVVTGWPYDDAPLALFLGARDRRGSLSELTFGAPSPVDVTAITSGDVDGDGVPDLAFVATRSGVRSVCVHLGSAVIDIPATLNAAVTCWSPNPVPAGFGASLAAADLDGEDGRDELLVGSDAGIDVVSFAAGTLTAEHIVSDYGRRITTVWPGRPGPGVWVATRADGSSLGLHRNRAFVKALPKPDQSARFGPGLR